ncbi:MAG: FAD-dependent oxidoreductase [Puniceicoccales bacterium]|jgi:thioredoxin reductase (NADPH)|nr:FAD-dependent oxidoreductase [Puniceicoccales bacterium]
MGHGGGISIKITSFSLAQFVRPDSIGPMEFLCQHVVVLGSGCAGLTAAIYSARSGYETVVVEGSLPGGQLTRAPSVENYPGFPTGISGYELISLMRKQAERFGVTFIGDEAKGAHVGEYRKIIRCENIELHCLELIVATGSSPMKLSVPGEDRYEGGGGVSSCATCDGPFYKGKVVAVVGGGNSAAAEALYLSNFCKKVYLIHRRDRMRATETTANKVLARKNIEPLWDSCVESIYGDDSRMSGLTLKNVNSGELSTLRCDGVFVSIGHRPNSDFARGFLEVDKYGYFIGAENDPAFTSVPGVFIAGDCADHTYRQAIVAAGSGARAALAMERSKNS